MVRPDRDRLKGWIEVDETHVGGMEEGVAGRKTESKVLVVIAAEADGPGIGRIRMRVIEDASTSDRRFPSRLRDEGSIFHGLSHQIASGVLCQPGAKHESFVIISNHFRLKVSFLHGLPAKMGRQIVETGG